MSQRIRVSSLSRALRSGGVGELLVDQTPAVFPHVTTLKAAMDQLDQLVSNRDIEGGHQYYVLGCHQGAALIMSKYQHVTSSQQPLCSDNDVN